MGSSIIKAAAVANLKTFRVGFIFVNSGIKNTLFLIMRTIFKEMTHYGSINKILEHYIER